MICGFFVGMSDMCPGDVLTQGFGCTDYTGEWVAPECVTGHFHTGVDRGTARGEPIFATRDGDVSGIGNIAFLGPFAIGLRVSSDGMHLSYGHCSAVSVAVGDHVTAGQLIGRVGSLGASTGPHVHLSANLDASVENGSSAFARSRYVDPTPYLHFTDDSGGSFVTTQAEFDAFMDQWVSKSGGFGPGSSSLPDEVKQELDKLGAIINTLANVTSGYAAGTSSLADEIRQSFLKLGDVVNLLNELKVGGAVGGNADAVARIEAAVGRIEAALKGA